MIKAADLYPVGKFTKTHGINGEISLVTDCDLADFFGYGNEAADGKTSPFIVCDMDGIWTPFFIESYRKKNATTTLVKFENPSSEEGVKVLSGKTAYVLSTSVYSENNHSGEWLFSEYTLVDEQLGTIGKVTDVDDRTLNILLKVDTGEAEILIPAALVTSIQHEHKIINVSLPEGFLEI